MKVSDNRTDSSAEDGTKSEVCDDKVRAFTERSETEETRSTRDEALSSMEEPIGTLPHAPIAILQGAMRADSPMGTSIRSGMKVKKRSSILAFMTKDTSAPLREEKIAFTEVSVDWQVRTAMLCVVAGRCTIHVHKHVWLMRQQ